MTHPVPNFDHISRIYRWAEYLALGRILERTREHFIPLLSDRRCALILGDGDGRFLAKLLRNNPAVRAVAVDTSPRMLDLLTDRCTASTPGASARFTTQLGSALEALPPPATDLITTHFLLDCFTQTEVDRLALHLAGQVATGTLWIVSDFAVPDRPLFNLLAKAYIRSLYFVFRILTGLRVTSLPDPQSALSAAGFELLNRYESAGGLLYSELWRRR